MNRSLKIQVETLSKIKIRANKYHLKTFMGKFSVMYSLYYLVKLIVYNSSYVNKSSEKIHRCSKPEIIDPIGCYIIFSGSLVHCGSKMCIRTKEEIPSSVNCLLIFDNS